jgi:hypothetical protein
MAQTSQRSWFDSSSKHMETSSWSDNLMGAVQRTVIISEILDSRTRHLIQVPLPYPLSIPSLFVYTSRILVSA